LYIKFKDFARGAMLRWPLWPTLITWTG